MVHYDVELSFPPPCKAEPVPGNLAIRCLHLIRLLYQEGEVLSGYHVCIELPRKWAVAMRYEIE